MKQVTLCICLQEDRVLLAMKKRGFGEGKWNGFGGKVEEGETIEEATVRELEQESTLIAKEQDLEAVGIVEFYFDTVLKFECHVFLLRIWEGSPQETEEMRPQFFPLTALPYEEMWAADTMWFPLVLAGKKIRAAVYFNTDGSVIESFTYTEL